MKKSSGSLADSIDKPHGTPIRYKPNEQPLGVMLRNLLLSIGLLGYGFIGLCRDEIYLPGKHGKGLIIHAPATWILFCAMICAAANLLAVIVDHYDKRNNEYLYRSFAKRTRLLGWVIFAIAVAVDLFLKVSHK